jgi:phosphoribosyl-ATP pyrophosphohydrolase/phosphoribosyl-AMP cyclohydrolase/histidinol dehydrogenase
MYSGVSTSSFQKYITSQELTKQGLERVGPYVIELANCEGLHAHMESVKLRLDSASSQ